MCRGRLWWTAGSCFALFSVSHFFIGQMALESPPESSALRVDLSRALLSARTRRGTNAAANDSNSSNLTESIATVPARLLPGDASTTNTAPTATSQPLNGQEVHTTSSTARTAAPSSPSLPVTAQASHTTGSSTTNTASPTLASQPLNAQVVHTTATSTTTNATPTSPSQPLSAQDVHTTATSTTTNATPTSPSQSLTAQDSRTTGASTTNAASPTVTSQPLNTRDVHTAATTSLRVTGQDSHTTSVSAASSAPSTVTSQSYTRDVHTTAAGTTRTAATSPTEPLTKQDSHTTAGAAGITLAPQRPRSIRPSTAYARGLNLAESQEVRHRSKCWANCTSRLKSPWLVLAGDTNWRLVFQLLQGLLEGAGLQVKSRAPNPTDRQTPEEVQAACMRPPNFKITWRGELCCPHYFDDDILYSFGPREIRISFRFVACAEQRLKISKETQRSLVVGSPLQRCCLRLKNEEIDFESFQICGQAPRIQMPVNHKAYHKPHMLVFNHGLWHLPDGNGTCNATFGHCLADKQDRPKGRQGRQMGIASALAEIQAAGISVLWASNPLVEPGLRVSRKRVKEDLSCQREAAKASNVSVLDVVRLLEPKALNYSLNRHYFKDVLAEQLLKDIMSELGCSC
ncbi:unnamed protein product [Effrenium voratum]|nr:unnamed protein product [Effrenium voratum]